MNSNWCTEAEDGEYMYMCSRDDRTGIVTSVIHHGAQVDKSKEGDQRASFTLSCRI